MRTARDVFATLLRLPAAQGGLVPFTMFPALDELLTAYDARDSVTGLPRYDEILYFVPKKFGKSEAGGGLGLTELVGGVDPDREIIVAASDLEQSRLFTFLSACRFVRRNKWLSKHVRILKGELVYTEAVTDPRTGGRHHHDHVMRVVAARDPKSLEGGRQTLTIVDEAHTATYDTVAALARSPARTYSRVVYLSYAGRRVDAVAGNVLWDVLARARAGTDPHLCLIERAGEGCWRECPWITERFIAQQRRQWAHVPSVFSRYYLNQWASGDEGSFLTADEIRDALDQAHVEPRAPVPGATYGLGLDLGLTHDLTGLVLSHAAPDGRLVVDMVRHWRGTRQQPVDLLDVETTVAALARTFRAALHVDQWQGALLMQRLQRQGIPRVTAHTLESSKLDAYASLVKGLFSARQVRVPPDPELILQLETIQGEELTRRDRIRFTSAPGQHDDLIAALCLSTEAQTRWRDVRGRLHIASTNLGRPQMAEISRCVAADVLGLSHQELACPLIEATSAHPGCRRCAPFAAALERQEATVRAGGPWRAIHDIASEWRPCSFVSAWQFGATCERLGL
jgi:hypothetical protein